MHARNCAIYFVCLWEGQCLHKAAPGSGEVQPTSTSQVGRGLFLCLHKAAQPANQPGESWSDFVARQPCRELSFEGVQAEICLSQPELPRLAQLPTRTQQRPQASPPPCKLSHGGSFGPGDSRDDGGADEVVAAMRLCHTFLRSWDGQRFRKAGSGHTSSSQVSARFTRQGKVQPGKQRADLARQPCRKCSL